MRLPITLAAASVANAQANGVTTTMSAANVAGAKEDAVAAPVAPVK
jgi:hypothetical protein